MATNPCAATIRAGPTITEVNARAGPGMHTEIVGTIPVGTTGLRVLDVRPDGEGKERDGKVFQWFRLRLPDDGTGWVRDDLLEIAGDCQPFGYDLLTTPTLAFDLTRFEREPQTPEQARIRRAAFNITASFEGNGYAAFQNHDAGVISYGRFQFTLASGSLFTVVDTYLKATPLNLISIELASRYYERLRDRDHRLRGDKRLKALLLAAAEDEAMQKAQDQVATERYWKRVQTLAILPRRVRTPLGQALLFDMAIHHGLYHNMLDMAEHRLKVEPKSRLGENGVTEQQLITEVARIRRDRLSDLAYRLNMGGLKVRGDFWVGLITRSDWSLLGDADGNVTTYVGKKVQVRDP